MSVCSTQKALQPNDIPLILLSLSLLPPLATSVFLSLHPSVYSGSGFFQSYRFHPLPSKSSNLQNLLLSLHKGSYVLLCVMLVSLDLLMFWQSADRPSSTFSPRPPSPPPDCNNVSKCGSACHWMGTLFNTTCHLSNPQLVTGGAETQSSEQFAVSYIAHLSHFSCCRISQYHSICTISRFQYVMFSQQWHNSFCSKSIAFSF